MSPPSQTAATAGTVLRVEDVSKTFTDERGRRIEALRGLSLEIESAKVTGLVGADGAGKTTLIRCAAGLLAPTEGRCVVLGLDSAQDTLQVQSRVGYMPQRFGLYEDLTVSENLNLYAGLQSVARKERKERFSELLDMTGLDEFTERRAGALSGGMKQKLGLACALVKSPEMLLLDEPTVGVDPVSRRDLWRIVYRLVEEDGIGVVLSTAYLDEADDCHKVVLLHEGEKLLEGTPGEFHERVESRVFTIKPGDEGGARPIQADLISRKTVVDATIRSGCVRVVMEEPPAGVSVREQAPERYRDSLQETAPTFEDAFMDAVPRSKEQRQAARREAPSESTRKDGEALVRAENLVKRFGSFEAVKGISFEVKRGEVFGLLGPNGAGKSTTFRMLCGLLPITEGSAQVAGRDLRRSRARARERLGYMAQTFSLYRQMSVLENFRFYGRAYGLDRKKLHDRIEWALNEFGLQKRKDTPAGALPGGYKQRLAMAAALLHEPDILFLDEPTSGVDPLARREFWIRIGRFASTGMTVIATTHFMEEAEYCDRMLIMSRGERLALGPPNDIRALVRSDDNPEPSIEDAFVALAKGEVSPRAIQSSGDQS